MRLRSGRSLTTQTARVPNQTIDSMGIANGRVVPPRAELMVEPRDRARAKVSRRSSTKNQVDTRRARTCASVNARAHTHAFILRASACTPECTSPHGFTLRLNPNRFTLRLSALALILRANAPRTDPRAGVSARRPSCKSARASTLLRECPHTGPQVGVPAHQPSCGSAHAPALRQMCSRVDLRVRVPTH